MKILRIFTALFGLALVLATFSPIVKADEWDKTTKITFKEPVQVPGKVLEPGTYVFKLLDSTSNRHVVQIFNEDHTQLITTVLAIPNERLQPADKTILTYQERPSDQPMALSAWFYPGDNFGQQFVYPKSEAEQLSRLNHQEVPSTGSEEAYPQLKERSTETAQNNNSTTAQPEAPAAQPAPQPANPPQTTNPEPPSSTNQPSSNAVAANQGPHLPHTASLLPLTGFIGICLLGIAAVLRLVVRA
jgi:hypothetical protein